MRTLILAGSFTEAARYARGKRITHYRYASSAANVTNFQAQAVVELPGFAKRLDRHSLIAVANRAVRRGAEWTKDSYTPPPVEVTLEEKVSSADWLFGAVPADLVAIGATPAEVQEVQDLQATAKRVESDLQDVTPVSGKSASRKLKTATVDDLFED